MKHFRDIVLAFVLLFAFGATRTHAQTAGPSAVSAPVAAPNFDFQAKFLSDMKDLQTKFIGLAQAIPQDKYTWRPGEGVRSISEVFLHVALGNYYLTSNLGAKLPDGFTPGPKFETSTTDKVAIIDQLNKSFEYMDSYIQGLNADGLQKPHQVFGRTMTGDDVLFTIVLDLHEHLGQQIAYARSNNVVPPWTAERQAAQAARGRGPAGTTAAAPSSGGR